MSHITYSAEIAADVEDVFGYVDDHLNTTKYMKGLSKWEPEGEKVHGKGARFAVAMKAGPMTLASVVEITTWTKNEAIGWTSREGFKQTGKWSFTEVDEGTTKASFDLKYELPGGIAGRMMSRATDPVVRGNIEQSVRALRTQVERSTKTSPAAKPAGKRVAAKTAGGTAAKAGSATSSKSASKPGRRTR